MIKNYFLTAFRTLTKNRSVSLLNILGLSAGMTAAVLIFLWVRNEGSFDDYHPDANRIYRVTSHLPVMGLTTVATPHPLSEAIHTGLPGAEIVTSMIPGYNTVLKVNDELLIEKKSGYIDSNWFRVFHYDFIRGSTADFFRNPYSLILTQSKAKKYFGEKDPIGLTIHKDTVDYRVAGVVRDNPINSSFQLDIFMPEAALLTNPDRRKQSMQWGWLQSLTFVKLRTTADPVRSANLMTGFLHKNKPNESRNFYSLVQLTTMHLEPGITSTVIAHGSRSTVYIFTVLGIFLLLIACINYVNLTTARASIRAKEVGIRKIVGAGKTSLFLQFVVESLLVSLASLTLTLVLVQLIMPLFRDLTDTNFQSPLASRETWEILGLTLLTATVLNSVYPALLLSSFRPLNVLKGAIILKFKDVYLRKSLVVLQFSFSIILIIGTIVIQRQLRYIQHTNPGYDRSQTFYFSLPNSVFKGKTPEEQTNLTKDIKAQLQAHTSISSVSVASESIVQLGSINTGSADWDGHDTSFSPNITQLSADEDYKNVMQVQLQTGRWFDPKLPTDKHNFILNETAINELNIHKPVLGQRFVFQQDTGRIIGVVKDFHFASLHEKITPLVVMNRDDWRSDFFIKTPPGKAPAALAISRSIFERYVHSRPFEYSFLDDEFDSLYRTDTKVSSLILSFSIIAIIISCLGLLGLASFASRQRIREIGIRKVLGATVTNILVLLSRDFIRLVLLSILIATPIAWWAMDRWLRDFAYHIPLSPWAFAGAGALAIGIALLTIGTQSIRTATSNPASILKIS